ncbi:glycerophosphodiester phosphodiesterase family protein [Endozoicomonas arenosclerae]|uniref:glycerophosphodiester phosphodiesterase family protein n=1 Tax=Endozoicomonas arenosclerae TaxID=1633495 RepID=UPI000AC03AC8|nr:glycerophosphodiester phosphodiesterase family protein [Endozoicomonas arenosclerae]
MDISVNTESQRLLTAHRGIPSKAPENTLSGIRLAAQLGARWVELDTQLSKDRIPVVMHDETLDRTTNGSGLLREKTLDELRMLDTGEWYKPEYSGELFPILEEVLEECKKLDLTLNLELKLYPASEPVALVERVIELLQENEFPLDKLLLSSFSREALVRCRELVPQVRRGFISDKADFGLNNVLKEVAPYSIHLDHRILTPEMARDIKGTGTVLAIWTMNEPEKVESFFDMGVDNIITDVIDQFK